MKKIKTLSVLNLVSLALHVFFSYGSQVGFVGRKTNAEVSDTYPTLFTPAGFTFAIWGIIYLGLLVFCIYHVVKAFGKDKTDPANEVVNRMGVLFMGTHLATVAWLFAFGNEQLLYSMLLLFVQLFLLIAIHIRLGIFDWKKGKGSVICTQIPLSIYFGWISIASIANTAIYLYAVQWNGGGVDPSTWTVIMIGVAVVIGFLMIVARRNIFFGLVICWGLFGLLSKRLDESGGDKNLIVSICYSAIAVLLLTIVLFLSFGLKKNKATQ